MSHYPTVQPALRLSHVIRALPWFDQICNRSGLTPRPSPFAVPWSQRKTLKTLTLSSPTKWNYPPPSNSTTYCMECNQLLHLLCFLPSTISHPLAFRSCPPTSSLPALPPKFTTQNNASASTCIDSCCTRLVFNRLCISVCIFAFLNFFAKCGRLVIPLQSFCFSSRFESACLLESLDFPSRLDLLLEKGLKPQK